MLVSGAGLRFVAFWNRRLRSLLKGFPSTASGSILLCPFGKMPQRESVSFAFILITGVVVLLAFDRALWMTFESALALYGPFLAVVCGYALILTASHLRRTRE
jgi:hypothetical protein